MRRAPLLLSLAVGLALASCNLDTFIVFIPVKTDAYALPHNHIPASLIEAPQITTSDGLSLGARLALQPDAASRPSVLYLHGQAENVDGAWDAVMRLWDVGYNVLAVDYRGFGTSEGSPSEAGLYRDAEAAMAYLGSDARLDPTRLVIWGFSLGTGVASWLAVHANERALVLESPFTSMSDMVSHSAPMTIPGDWVTESELDTEGRIADIGAALVVGHGKDDVRIPFWMGEAVYDAAREPKALVAVAGADHGDVIRVALDRVLEALATLAPEAVP